jgi:hypothetical protein
MYTVGGEFGIFKWSNNENKLLYLAERLVKNAEYFDEELEWENPEKMTKSGVVRFFGY